MFQNNIFQNGTCTGKEFTDYYNKSNTKFYKILKEDLVHNRYKFIDGLNIDPIPFNPKGSCSAGGFYFTEYDKIAHWLTYTKNLTYIAEITIPDDAQVYIEENKFKTDKFILNLKDMTTIKDHKCWYDADFCKLAVQRCGYDLQYVNIPQTEALCKFAVKQNGFALKYVNIPQTDALCKMAVQQDGLALEFVNNQTPELCELAVRQNGLALQFVVNQSSELCELAVQQNGYALYHVINRNDNICELAAQRHAYIKISIYADWLVNKCIGTFQYFINQ
jgi:hypothetical protein